MKYKKMNETINEEMIDSQVIRTQPIESERGTRLYNLN